MKGYAKLEGSLSLALYKRAVRLSCAYAYFVATGPDYIVF